MAIFRTEGNSKMVYDNPLNELAGVPMERKTHTWKREGDGYRCSSCLHTPQMMRDLGIGASHYCDEVEAVCNGKFIKGSSGISDLMRGGSKVEHVGFCRCDECCTQKGIAASAVGYNEPVAKCKGCGMFYAANKPHACHPPIGTEPKRNGMSIIMRAGEWMRCRAGHGIARAVRDIYDGELKRREDFTEWMMAEPNSGDELVCPCGEEYGPQFKDVKRAKPARSEMGLFGHEMREYEWADYARGETKKVCECTRCGQTYEQIIAPDVPMKCEPDVRWQEYKKQRHELMNSSNSHWKPVGTPLSVEEFGRRYTMIDGELVERTSGTLARAMAAPLPHSTDIHERLMPWRQRG